MIINTDIICKCIGELISRALGSSNSLISEIGLRISVNRSHRSIQVDDHMYVLMATKLALLLVLSNLFLSKKVKKERIHSTHLISSLTAMTPQRQWTRNWLSSRPCLTKKSWRHAGWRSCRVLFHRPISRMSMHFSWTPQQVASSHPSTLNKLISSSWKMTLASEITSTTSISRLFSFLRKTGRTWCHSSITYTRRRTTRLRHYMLRAGSLIDIWPLWSGPIGIMTCQIYITWQLLACWSLPNSNSQSHLPSRRWLPSCLLMSKRGPAKKSWSY